jgi:hypothetical protein
MPPQLISVQRRPPTDRTEKNFAKTNSQKGNRRRRGQPPRPDGARRTAPPLSRAERTKRRYAPDPPAAEFVTYSSEPNGSYRLGALCVNLGELRQLRELANLLLGPIDHDGEIEAYSPLLNVVLHDQLQIRC